jgi:hypothetical protein
MMANMLGDYDKDVTSKKVARAEREAKEAAERKARKKALPGAAAVKQKEAPKEKKPPTPQEMLPMLEKQCTFMQKQVQDHHKLITDGVFQVKEKVRWHGYFILASFLRSPPPSFSRACPLLNLYVGNESHSVCRPTLGYPYAHEQQPPDYRPRALRGGPAGRSRDQEGCNARAARHVLAAARVAP